MDRNSTETRPIGDQSFRKVGFCDESLRISQVSFAFCVVDGSAEEHNFFRAELTSTLVEELFVNQNVKIAGTDNDLETSGVPHELAELAQLIVTAKCDQQSKLQSAFDRVVDSVHRRRRVLELVQEALSQLRLDIKYMMFDLEVTRKERDELRQQLEDQ